MPAFSESVGLALVGYRGTGKSTVGRLTAHLLRRSFIDADDVLESRAGRSIRSIFEVDGEHAFRDWEEKVLVEIAREPAGKVLATGGGAILRETNREILKRFGHVVWLRADPASLANRLKYSSGRPALTAAGLIPEIVDVLAHREPFYREVADTVIETDGKTPQQVSTALIAALDPPGMIDRRKG